MNTRERNFEKEISQKNKVKSERTGEIQTSTKTSIQMVVTFLELNFFTTNGNPTLDVTVRHDDFQVCGYIN